MRIINVTILENEMKPDSTIAGMAGDNLNTKLSIEIPESWDGCTYRLKFKTSNQPDGYAYVSDSISLTSGKIEFLLPSSVMVAGKLWVQSVAEKASGSDTVVVNSATMVLNVGRSIGEQCDEYGFPPNYSGLIDQTLNEINDEITAQANIAKTQAANSAASATAAANSAASATAEANRSKSEADRAASIDAFTKAEADTRYSNALTGTASGAMAHMTDVSGIGSLRRLAVLGETTETGTGDKGPDNPYSVDGVVPTAVSAAGKNLIGLESPYQIASSVVGAGSATVERYNNGVTLTMPSASSATWAAERLWWPITAGTYTLQVKMETNDSAFTPALGVYLKKTLTDTAAALTTVTASGSKTIMVGASGYIGLYLHLTMDTGNTGTRTVRYYDIQLEPGNTVTDYEPYTGTTVTLPTLEPLYGDGTVSDEYDAATGIETRRWKRMELDGTENWHLSGTVETSKYRPTLVLSDIVTLDSNQVLPDIVCTHYQTQTMYNSYRCTTGVSMDTTASNGMAVYDANYDTNSLAAWKAYLAAQKAAGTPVTVVYRLTEPVVTQRDPARVIPPAPVCNVYADQGDVDVTYNRDINMALTVLPGDVVTQDQITEQVQQLMQIVATKDYVDQQLGAIENGSY
mgnify:CR=1 FL=1